VTARGNLDEEIERDEERDEDLILTDVLEATAKSDQDRPQAVTSSAGRQ